MYLEARQPLLITTNPQITLRSDPQHVGSQAGRAASLVHASAVFYRTLRDGHLEPDLFHTKPRWSRTRAFEEIVRAAPRSVSFYAAAAAGAYALDMSQYDRLFKSTRIPSLGRDELRGGLRARWGRDRCASGPGSGPRHIVVQRDDRFYAVDVLDAAGDALEEAAVRAALEAILDGSAGRLPGASGNERPNEGVRGPLYVGACTALPRDEWARLRPKLEAESPTNAATLADIDSALFMVCLDGPLGSHGAEADPIADEDSVQDLVARSRAMLHGDGARNRWLDKSFQLIVDPAGEAAINFEHAWGDGVAVLRFCTEIVGHCDARAAAGTAAGTLKQNGATRGGPRGSTAGSIECMAPVKALGWSVGPSTADEVRRAAEENDALIDSTDMAVLRDPRLTSAWIKRSGLSPDGVMQSIFQLAHFRMHGGSASTYESASTAAFKHGRTETIRSATCHSHAMCEAFSRPSVELEPLEALRGRSEGTAPAKTDPALAKDLALATRATFLDASARNHARLTREALTGAGFDRHLFALRAEALRDVDGCEARLPPLFRGRAWKTLQNIVLSTSTVGSDLLQGGGFGPVGADCYAIGYGVRAHGAQISVMSYKRGAQRFVDECRASIALIREAVEARDRLEEAMGLSDEAARKKRRKEATEEVRARIRSGGARG
jgi:carnitine O-palmitoyltransferase 2